MICVNEISCVADFLKAIGEQQEKLGLSDYQIAKDTGVSRATLSRWKSGDREPRIFQLLTILDYLNIKLMIS